MDLGVASFAAITVIAYLVGYIWKTADKLSDKWIPCVCGVSGCILGIIAYIIKVPDFPANDILNSAAVGVVSGFAATGINQIYKQLIKNNDVTDSNDSSDTAINVAEVAQSDETDTVDSESADTKS